MTITHSNNLTHSNNPADFFPVYVFIVQMVGILRDSGDEEKVIQPTCSAKYGLVAFKHTGLIVEMAPWSV